MSMFPIASYVVGAGGTNNLTFSSIPQTFQHLQLRISGRSTNTGGSYATIYCGFNGDAFAAPNYANHYMYGEGTSATSSSSTSVNQMNIGGGQFVWNSVLANVQGALVIDILDYSSAIKNKTVRYLMGWDANGSGRSMLGYGLWMNTNAINSIYLSPDAGWAQYTRLDLYGISTSNVSGA